MCDSVRQKLGHTTLYLSLSLIYEELQFDDIFMAFLFLFLQIDVSQFLTPSFHPTFVGVLRILSEQNTEVKQQRAFKRFVRDYGTHYLSSAFLGTVVIR